MLKNIFVLISYQHNGDWLKYSLGTFREHFPFDRLLVVNHSKNKEEVDFIRKHATIMIDKSDDMVWHGPTLDFVTKIVSKNYDMMTLFEPDCLIFGRGWYENMYQAILHGAWMAGPIIVFENIIHVCPSSWKLSEIKHEFNNSPITEVLDVATEIGMWDEDKQYYVTENEKRKIIHVHPGTRQIDCLNGPKVTIAYWDTAQKNWYYAAKAKKAVVTANPDFHHLWEGRNGNKELEVVDLLRNNALSLLSPSPQIDRHPTII